MDKKYYAKPVLTFQKFSDEVNTAEPSTSGGIVYYPWRSNGKDFEKEERF